MSSTLISHDGTPNTGNRRVSTREKIDGFGLVFYEEDNWGTLVNISTGGMAFEFTRPPTAPDSNTFVIEVLSLGADWQSPSSVQTEGRLVWTNEHNKIAGIQFANLAEAAQRQLNEWLSIASAPIVADAPYVPQERLTSVNARLRELFSVPLKTPAQGTPSAHRQYLDSSVSHLEKMNAPELPGREALAEAEPTFQPTTGSMAEATLLECPTMPRNPASETLAQEADANQSLDLQSQLFNTEESVAFEVLEVPESKPTLGTEASLTDENSLEPAEQPAPLEPFAEKASFIHVTEATSLEPAPELLSHPGVAEASPVELIATPPDYKSTLAPVTEPAENPTDVQSNDIQWHDHQSTDSAPEEIVAFELSESSDRETPVPSNAHFEPASKSAEAVEESITETRITEPLSPEQGITPFVYNTPAVLVQAPGDTAPSGLPLSNPGSETSETAECVEPLEVERGLASGPQLEPRLPVKPTESVTELAEHEPVVQVEVAFATVSEGEIPVAPEPQLAATPKSPRAASVEAVIALQEANETLRDRQSNPVTPSEPSSDNLTRLELDPKPTSPSLLRHASDQLKAAGQQEFVLGASNATKSDLGELPQLTDQRPGASGARLDRVALFCIIGCFARLLVLGLGMMLSQANRMAAAAVFENVRKPFMTKTSRTPVAPPVGEIKQFQVEVVDVRNRRWLLNVESPAASKVLVNSSADPAAKNPKHSQPEVSANPASQTVSKPNPSTAAPAPVSLTKENAQPLAGSVDSKPTTNSPKDDVKQPPEIAPNTTSDPTKDLAKETAAGLATQSSSQPAQPSRTTTQPEADVTGQPKGQPTVVVSETSPGESPTGTSDPAQQAVLISSVPPVYPMAVRYQNIEGDVIVDAFINENGHITNTKAISGPKVLQQAAMDSVRLRRYKPATLRGQALSSHVYVTVKFRLK